MTSKWPTIFKNGLKEIRNAVLEMTVVKIVSNSEEDSYTIFEILNARGQELAAHELLKNYIMRYIQPVERRDDAKGHVGRHGTNRWFIDG